MERLSALDAEFLHVEDGIAHMHLAGACVFEGPIPEYGDVEQLLRSKLHLIPRYRQRVRSVPLELGRPVWVDDPHFDLGFHLRHAALPAPGDAAALDSLMGRVMSLPLDRERPLWEVWFVEGLAQDRWALLFKVHHCMIDGIAGVQLLTVLLDLTREVEPVEEVAWEPEPEPSGAAKVLDAWSGLASDVAELGKGLPRALTNPVGTARTVGTTVGGLARYLRGLAAGEPHSLSGSIGPHRAWSHSEVSLAEVKEVRAAFGGTVNDVVLAVVAAGYRELLLWRGDDADRAEVTSMVPVSTRREDARGVPDNRVSMVLCELPVHLADPLERLRSVQEQMGEAKASHEADAGEVVTQAVDLAPPMVVGPLSRLIIRALRRRPQRLIDTVTTNVPGPQFPLYCLGREMVSYLPYVPIYHGVRVGTAILSYNGKLAFGVTGDRTSVPDVHVMAGAFPAALDELRELAATRGRAR